MCFAAYPERDPSCGSMFDTWNQQHAVVIRTVNMNSQLFWRAPVFAASLIPRARDPKIANDGGGYKQNRKNQADDSVPAIAWLNIGSLFD